MALGADELLAGASELRELPLPPRRSRLREVVGEGLTFYPPCGGG